MARVAIDAVASNADETTIAKTATLKTAKVVQESSATSEMSSVMPSSSQSRSGTQSLNKLKALSLTLQPCTKSFRTGPTSANFSAFMSGFAKLMTGLRLWISSSRLRVDNQRTLTKRTFRPGII